MKTIQTVLILVFVAIYVSACQENDSNVSVITTFENGNISCISFSKDTLNADRIYLSETGHFYGIEKYKAGKKHGESHFFYEGGRMKEHWIWFEGHPDGPCYNYGDSYTGYPMEFMLYGGNGQLVYREKFDTNGVSISKEGKMPNKWSE